MLLQYTNYLHWVPLSASFALQKSLPRTSLPQRPKRTA